MPSGRAAALEILLDTPRIRDLIKRGETDAIKDAMEQGVNEGCATFDAALFELVRTGRVARERGDSRPPTAPTTSGSGSIAAARRPGRRRPASLSSAWFR